ncbi:MAG TPA: hypothetical protein DHM37_09240 [Candidatus Cloacimonas sp.]|jgi:hypothetical protein|nr:hypothetical protein [Candidatus Cloacimonadota bacterium]HCX73888.1 hypothetical protein [Candidatus Cloacimonas sp.]
MMQSEHTKEFKRDFKKLKKKFRILYTDFDNFKDIQLKLFHNIGIDNRGIVKISGLGIEYPSIYKARKFACRTLKGTDSKSGIRIIYAYFPDQDKIGFSGINYKGDKENEDRERIKRFLR